MASWPPEALAPAIAAIDRHGLSEHRAAILAAARPSIRLRPERSTLESIPLGASRFGGRPDLPFGHVWPTNGRSPLHFLASVALDDAGVFDLERRLPPTGQLCFWYDAYDQPWGIQTEERGAFCVEHLPRTDLIRTPRPSVVDENPSRAPREFPPARIRLGLEATLVPATIDRPEMPYETSERYDELVDELTPEDSIARAPSHRLLGWPRPVHDDPARDAQDALDPPFSADPDGYWAARARWKLLLQLDSDEDLEWCWGDWGRLYFMIREADLAAGRFHDVWMRLQCS